MCNIIKKCSILIVAAVALAFIQPLDAAKVICPDFVKDGINKAVREMKIAELDGAVESRSLICSENTVDRPFIDNLEYSLVLSDAAFFINSTGSSCGIEIGCSEISNSVEAFKVILDDTGTAGTEKYLDTGVIEPVIVEKCSNYAEESLIDAGLIVSCIGGTGGGDDPGGDLP